MDRHERTFRELVDELPDLVCRLAPDGTLLYANQAYVVYFEADAELIIGRSYLELVPDDCLVECRSQLEAVRLLTPDSPVRISEHAGGDLGGERRYQQWVDKALFDPDGRLVDLLCVGRDITERVRSDEQVRYHSRHDSLTGLVNRRCTLEALEQAVAHANRYGTPLGLLYVDLDGFKRINDRFGHRAGDRLLADVADVLAGTVRQTDSVGRLGGDEFVVICPSTASLAELAEVGDRINDRLARINRPCHASVGAVVRLELETAEGLLHRADEAMYAVKQRRGGHRSIA